MPLMQTWGIMLPQESVGLLDFPGNIVGLLMQKLLIIIGLIASLCLTVCSCSRLVHKIDIQQGNVITQDEVNLLEPGMTRRQVQFIMGSPMIADVFHQDRWDYVYVLWPGYGEPTGMRIALFFDDDLLTGTSGTLHPDEAGRDAPARPKQVTLVVPPEERVPPGIFNRIWHWLTFRKADEDSYVPGGKDTPPG
jgi:outer membrane protein assembly factor BamE